MWNFSSRRFMRDVEGVVERIGGQGDGVLQHGGLKYYVPYTVPGDRVAARIGKARGDGFAATLHEVQTPGPGRVVPPCPHFHSCGGCALQQWADTPYLEWKRGQVRQALVKRGLESAEVEPTVTVPPNDRRRADLVALRTARKVLIGLHERDGKRLVDMESCDVIDRRLVDVLPPLRDLLAQVLPVGTQADVVMTLTETGIDLALGRFAPTQAQRVRLVRFAEQHDLARVALLGGDGALVIRRVPVLRFGGVPVELPPGGFVQASPSAEAGMTQVVVDGLAGTKKIVDLFSGLGTFSLPLVGRAQVHAVDGDAGLITALQAGANRAVLGGRISSEKRDLFRRPLSAKELGRFDAVLFDPPRVGAREQALEIAKSNVPVVAAVSCYPTSFARDARLLADGGYGLERVVPFDQFRWSPHVEVVAIFRRK